MRDAVRSLTSCRQAAAQLAALEREQRNGDSYAGSNQGDDASSVWTDASSVWSAASSASMQSSASLESLTSSLGACRGSECISRAPCHPHGRALACVSQRRTKRPSTARMTRTCSMCRAPRTPRESSVAPCSARQSAVAVATRTAPPSVSASVASAATLRRRTHTGSRCCPRHSLMRSCSVRCMWGWSLMRRSVAHRLVWLT